MDTLQCAIVLAKMERFDWEVPERQLVGARYNELCDSARIGRIHQRPDRTSVFAQYTILSNDRTAVQENLKNSSIPTAIHYPLSLNQQPYYTQHCCPDCVPVSRYLAKTVLSLPMSPNLSLSSQQKIISTVVATK
jgi:UDP-2-acetamido-2-deoxy-ribo-hexuluronate aminotransferase